jgi:thioredoxin reductase (NADPH)
MVNANIDQRGFVTTDNKGKSSVEGLYVAGDLRANMKKQIYTAWDMAVDSADEINLLIRRKKRTDTTLL